MTDPLERPRALDNIGAHLLGRHPSPPDARDFALAPFLAGDPLEVALEVLTKSGHGAPEVRAWASLATARILGASPSPAPSPAPTPPAGDFAWPMTEAPLDQGQTPHCVGFSGAGYENTQPVDDHATNATGDELYYACKEQDGEPGAEDGSDIRSLAKVLQAKGRINAYAFAGSFAEGEAWVRTKGPLIVATDWWESMFSTDAEGRVELVGDPLPNEGHAYVWIGSKPSLGAQEFLNSWGLWGLTGRFFVKDEDVAGKLVFANGGEALAAVELPVA